MRRRFLGLLALLAIIFISGCFTIHVVYQPATVTTGEKIIITIDVTTNTVDQSPKKAVACIMVPNDWVVDSAGMISEYYTANTEEPLEVMDTTWRWTVCAEKYFPSGPNMKWVCTKGTEDHTAPDETLAVEGKFYVTVGEMLGTFDLCYLVSDTGLFDAAGDTIAFDPDWGPGSANAAFWGGASWDSSCGNTITVIPPPAPFCSLSCIPDTPTVSRNGILGYRVCVTCTIIDGTKAELDSFFYFTNVTLPNGYTYPASGWLMEYGPVTLANGETRCANVRHQVPNGAPIGDYTYNAFIGLPEDIWDECHFDFTVTASKFVRSSANCNDWQVLENGFANSSRATMSIGLSTPSAFLLYQNQPNPAHELTMLSYSLANDSYVKLVVYDVLGQPLRTLADGRQLTGLHTVIWDGKDNTGREVTSGIYFYKIEVHTDLETRVANYTDTKKMILLR